MIIFLPVHEAVVGIQELAKDFLKKGSLADHGLRICSRKEDEALAYEIGDALSDHFSKVTLQTLPEKKRSAIQLSNEFFTEAFNYLKNYVAPAGELPEPPCLFMDPTYRPSSNGWLASLQAEFFLRSAPPSLGRTLPGPEPKSRVYVGPVVFGKKITQNPDILPILSDTVPWRERLCWLLSKDSVETKLIGSGNKAVIRPKP